MKTMFAAFAAATLFGVPVMAQAPAETPFIAKAVQHDVAETMLGELAAKQGSTPAVRAYGAMLAKDHGQHKVKSVEMAKYLKVSASEQPNSDQLASYNELKGKTGKDFDDAFVEHMIMDHQQDINLYQKAYADGSGPITAFAVKTLPVLKKHLAVAQGLKS